MAIKMKRGFTLLIAMIFVGVILAFAATTGALGYKQSILASNAIQSQYAFYSADTGLECALYYDLAAAGNPMSYGNYNGSNLPAISCDGSAATAPSNTCYNAAGCASEVVYQYRISLAGGTRCVDLSFYEPGTTGAQTYLFSQGYNTSCAAVAAGTSRVVARGLETNY